MDRYSRFKWNVPLKACWPRKPNSPSQYLGVPIQDTKGTLIAVLRPSVEYETDPAYHNRIGQATLDARHICKIHNDDIKKKPRETSRASSNRKASGPDLPKSVRLGGGPSSKDPVHPPHKSEDFSDW